MSSSKPPHRLSYAGSSREEPDPAYRPSFITRFYWWIYMNPILTMAYIWALLMILGIVMFGLLYFNVGGMADGIRPD